MSAIALPVLAAELGRADPSSASAEFAEARRWSAAKFEGSGAAPDTEPGSLVLTNQGPAQMDTRGGRRPFKIGRASGRERV